jgi:hypothetical protein
MPGYCAVDSYNEHSLGHGLKHLWGHLVMMLDKMSRRRTVYLPPLVSFTLCLLPVLPLVSVGFTPYATLRHNMAWLLPLVEMPIPTRSAARSEP